jgi:hypothetical protein
MKVPFCIKRARRASGAIALLALVACLTPSVASAALPDGRGWEMVSPIDKNGGAIAGAGQIAGGGVLQAAADGGSVTYGSAASFAGGQGAPEGSQYLSTRNGGWSTQNITVPVFSGSYGTKPQGVPYQFFSPDLSSGLLLSGRHCRSEEGTCPVANPPLAGTDAPAGYQNYYLRKGAGFEALLGPGDVVNTNVGPADFELTLVGSTADLAHVVLSSCAALTSNATEVALGEGCDPAKQNLYEWSAATGSLTLINAAPGAGLGAQSGAISANGSRVYLAEGGNLFLHEGGGNTQVDADAGGGGTFETASADGSVAFFTKEAHLWRYETATGTATDLTPAGEVKGVLGASADGSYSYYLATDGLHLLHGTDTKIAAAPEPLTEAAAEASNYPPATGTARLSADGTKLLFASKAALTNYNNTDTKTGLPDTELFLYSATGAGTLRCVSCRPNSSPPSGPSSVPGAIANGSQEGATRAYKPRALSTDASRVFFDSADALASGDSNNESDVYEWEAQGLGCTKAVGCISLLSSGRSEGGASFVDASSSGNDAFFLTDASLVEGDPGSVDLYDARVGGGFPVPRPPISCFGDSCQQLPSEPVDPGLTTGVSGPGNPKIHYVKHGHAAKKHCKAKKCQKQGKGKKQTGKGEKKGRDR